MGTILVGVGLLLFTQEKNPRLFVVRELKGKPALCKEAGMISFPLETCKEVDGSLEGTVARLVEEEIGLSMSAIDLCGIDPERFRLIPGRSDVDTRYGYGIFLGNPEQFFHPKDDDIEFAGWMSCESLLNSFIRAETAPIINHFLVNHHWDLIKRINSGTA